MHRLPPPVRHFWDLEAGSDDNEERNSRPFEVRCSEAGIEDTGELPLPSLPIYCLVRCTFLCQFSSPKSRNQSIILGKRSWTWLADTAGLYIYFLIAHRLFIPTDILNMPRVTNSQTLILPVAEKLELVVLPCAMPTPLFSS
jgi:hypothetical protein